MNGEQSCVVLEGAFQSCFVIVTVKGQPEAYIKGKFNVLNKCTGKSCMFIVESQGGSRNSRRGRKVTSNMAKQKVTSNNQIGPGGGTSIVKRVMCWLWNLQEEAAKVKGARKCNGGERH